MGFNADSAPLVPAAASRIGNDGRNKQRTQRMIRWVR
jgi:hypothetical protein